jgi:formamidopyrimidine-DNA glycosylase
LSFADRIAGARVTGVRVGKPLRWALGCEPRSLLGQQVLGVRRRGKYLLVDLNDGLLLWHLGMSGSLLFGNDRSAPQAHDHFDLDTTQGLLRLNDPRRFGAVVFAPSEQSAEAVKLLGHLGVEPLNGDFALDAFHAGLRKRKTAIKQVLLGGELVVGVGNIYASEALFLAGIRPTSRAERISRPRAEKLRLAVIDVLARAVKKVAAPCATSLPPTARPATFSSKPMCMTAWESLAACAARPFDVSNKASVPPTSAPCAKNHDDITKLWRHGGGVAKKTWPP